MQFLASNYNLLVYLKILKNSIIMSLDSYDLNIIFICIKLNFKLLVTKLNIQYKVHSKKNKVPSYFC